MIEIEDYYMQLPGGRCYQKGGARLETATFNCIPESIKKHIKQNLRPKKDNGDVIVEYDMLYVNGKEMISIEVKGLNNKTSNCPERQNKLLNQAIRQKQFLDEMFITKGIKICVVFCFVTGKNSSSINQDFINELINNDIIVGVGETPNETIKNVIIQLKKNGFLSNHFISGNKPQKPKSTIPCGCQIKPTSKMNYLDAIKKNHLII
jgi:hypothetical protein